jgi:collagen type III alpha
MAQLLDNDKNGDGKISKEEAPERLKERFDFMDGNGDGFIDKDELEKMAQRFRGRGGPSGRGRGRANRRDNR